MQKSRNGFPVLTPREREVVMLVCEGKRNKQIATKLKVSTKTVEAHRGNVMAKWRVSNTAELFRAAIKTGTVRIR